MDVIGFIGLGAMGGKMVNRLTDAGYTVWAYDVSADALKEAESHGAKVAKSVTQVAEESNVVLLSLPSPQIVRDVVLGPDGIIATGGVDCVIDLSTTGLTVAREIAAGLDAAGVEAIDAPVSGGARGAAAGTLAIMVATKEATFEKRKAILEVLGQKITLVGNEPGQGQVIKLVNNLISSAAMVATAEGMVLGAKAGLDPEIMLEVLNSSTGKNSHTEDKFPRFVLPRTFNFGFTIGLLHKDVQLGLQMAEALGVPTPVIGAGNQIWNMALAEGGPNADMTTIVQYFERWAGTEVKGKSA